LAIKNITGKGHVVVPPDRPPLHSRIGTLLLRSPCLDT
jgi:hypothetical protein